MLMTEVALATDTSPQPPMVILQLLDKLSVPYQVCYEQPKLALAQRVQAVLLDDAIGALLVLYPVLLVAGGYRPSVRRVPQVLAFLFGSALPIYFLNKPLHTNFYFLNNPYGNVITSTFTAWFGEKFYILGFLPAIALALVLMYAPWAAAGKKR